MDRVNARWAEYGIQPMERTSDPGIPYGLFSEWWDTENIAALRALRITP